MLEFRRSSNDRQTRNQLVLYAAFTGAVGFILTGSILEWHLPGILIGTLCFVVGCYTLSRSVMSLLKPFEHLCTFTPTCVHWSATNDAYPPGRIDTRNIQAVHVDFDDDGLSFDTGTLIAQGIRADIGITTDKLEMIRDYILTHWTSVTVYCIERGERRCVSRTEECQNQAVNPSRR